MPGRKSGIVFGAIFMVLVLFVGCVYNAMSEGSYKATIINAEGEDIGVVYMNETEAGVLMNIQIANLGTGKGEHAMHIHEVAKCSADDEFKDAGGHYNPMMKMHGLMHAEGAHAGDMPNIRPNESGGVDVTTINTNVTLKKQKNAPEGRFTLFDKDGSSLIIHAGADDHKSQPSGAAGARIACAKIK